MMSKNAIYIKIKHWNEKEAKSLFPELPFYNVTIETPKIRDLKNIDLLKNFLFVMN